MGVAVEPEPSRARVALAAVFVMVAAGAVSAFAARVTVGGASLGPLPVLLADGVLVTFATLVLEGKARTRVFAALGLDGPAPIAIACGLAASLPLAIALASTRPLVLPPKPLHLVRLALATALADEIVFRGYALHALARRARLRPPVAALVTSIAFGLVRVATAYGYAPIGDLVEIGVLGAAVGGWFSWLVLAWRDGLWIALALHFGMNLAWSLFVGDLVAGSGDVASHVGRAASLGASVALTLAARRLLATSSAAPSGPAG